MRSIRSIFASNGDLALVLLVIGILIVLFAPIPSPVLDFLILANISLAMLILLLTFYMAKPVEFSTFPALLLVATLFRLSLNVAATRLILQHSDAGRVIAAVGNLVVGGNYVIGIIVFLILVVVQYVVVTSGAQRVSEVAARFTLDSMPGQQMSIDADLNMGFIDQAEAQRRRRNLSKESAFYGAMDGASKFVKGDAIAGIMIMMVNIVGGLIVGVVQMGMHWDQALKTFTLLTVGDGIVTQVPALIISVGTGLIVTRSATDSSLGAEALKQVTVFPKTLVLVMTALAGMMFLPGLPAWPIAILISGFAAAIFVRRRFSANDESLDASKAETNGDSDPYKAIVVEPIEVLLGASLVSFLAGDQPVFMERVAAFRRQHAADSGLVVPNVRLRSSPKLHESAYEICIYGVVAGRGEIHKDKLLALKTAMSDGRKVAGIETKDPAFGLPALWIDESEKGAASAAHMTVVDATTAFITHLCEVLRQHSADLLSRRETERLLASVRESQPGLVEELIPTAIAVGDVQKVLQALLRERVSIRNVEQIVEALLDATRQSEDVGVLTELVRQRLGPLICQSLVPAGAAMNVLTLDPALEQALQESLRPVREGAKESRLFIEPRLAEQLLLKVAQQCERMATKNILPVLLCAPDLRRHVRLLTERALPQLRVLSMSEIPNTAELRAFGSIAV